MTHRILNNRLGLVFILLALFMVNFIQTQMEGNLKTPAQYETGYKIAQAFMDLEGNLDFSQVEGLGKGAAIAIPLRFIFYFPCCY